MAIRSDALQEFLDSLKENFAAAKSDPAVSTVIDVLFADLSRPAPAGLQHPRRLPACRHLPDAIDLGKSASPELAACARLQGDRAIARMAGPRLGRTLRQRQLARRPRQCDDCRFGVRARDPRRPRHRRVAARAKGALSGPQPPSRRGLPLADARPFSARRFGLDGVGSRRDAAQRTAHQARHGLGRSAPFGVLVPVDRVTDRGKGAVGQISVVPKSERGSFKVCSLALAMYAFPHRSVRPPGRPRRGPREIPRLSRPSANARLRSSQWSVRHDASVAQGRQD